MTDYANDFTTVTEICIMHPLNEIEDRLNLFSWIYLYVVKSKKKILR